MLVNRDELGDAVPSWGPSNKPRSQMVLKGKKSAADAARLFGVHPSTVCRLLAPYRQRDGRNAGRGLRADHLARMRSRIELQH